MSVVIKRADWNMFSGNMAPCTESIFFYITVVYTIDICWFKVNIWSLKEILDK